jgi:hypothetical protein
VAATTASGLMALPIGEPHRRTVDTGNRGDQFDLAGENRVDQPDVQDRDLAERRPLVKSLTRIGSALVAEIGDAGAPGRLDEHVGDPWGYVPHQHTAHGRGNAIHLTAQDVRRTTGTTSCGRASSREKRHRQAAPAHGRADGDALLGRRTPTARRFR